jgi:hypothetical protein
MALMLPQIVSFNSQQRSILFANGREETDVDKVAFCTGYNYDYLSSKHFRDLKGKKGLGTQTYQHIFFTAKVTLAFVLLPLRAVAFPFAESQATVIAWVWSGRLGLPPLSNIKAWTENSKKSRGTGKNFHKLSYPVDSDYMNEMYEWCLQAEDEKKEKGKGKYHLSGATRRDG